jgi:predicted TIM-barrel fold metal-dependent hydrolase
MLFPNTNPVSIDRDIWLNTKMGEQNPDVDLVLVISPAMLREDEALTSFVSLPFKMIKLHGFLHNWHPNGKLIKSVFRFAAEHKVPVMLHTGGCERSNAGNYLKICSQFPNVRVILAHSRPFDQTVAVMLECPNVWADTSFVSPNKVKLFEKEGLIDRVIFGTDFPVAAAFDDEPNLGVWYQRNLSKVASVLGREMFKKISNENYLNFYS